MRDEFKSNLVRQLLSLRAKADIVEINDALPQ